MMPFGSHVARCHNCGKQWMVGDCIPSYCSEKCRWEYMEREATTSPHQWFDEFFHDIGCRKRGTDYILDGFTHEFYLRFDTADVSEEFPEAAGTCDIYVVPLDDDALSIRIRDNCTKQDVLRLMFALRVSRFSEKTRAGMYKHVGSPLRNEEQGAV